MLPAEEMGLVAALYCLKAGCFLQVGDGASLGGRVAEEKNRY